MHFGPGRPLPNPQNVLNSQLIELFIRVATLSQSVGIKRRLLQLACGLSTIALAQQHIIGRSAAIDLLEQLLYLGIGIEATRLLLEYVVGTHAAKRKIPHALLILGAVGMCIKVARTCIACIF